MIWKEKNSYLILLTLLALFSLRVLGQMAVEFDFTVAGVHLSAFLPSTKEWQSGLLSYPILLFFQISIIGLFAKVCFDFNRGEGFFFDANKFLGNPLMNFAKLYFFGNSIRLVIWTTILREHHIWYSGFIPIVFHYVLASFLFIVANHHCRQLHRQRHSLSLRNSRASGVLSESVR